MKKLMSVAILAALATGCGVKTAGGRRIYFFSTVAVMVVNDCKGAGLKLKTVHEDPVGLSYGQTTTLVLERQFGDSDEQAVVAQGYAADGTYLGSTSRQFYTYTGSYGGNLRQEVWHIQWLQGGKGCGLP